MIVDVKRWHRLQQELLTLAAQSRGLGQTLFELEGQRQQTESARLRLMKDAQSRGAYDGRSSVKGDVANPAQAVAPATTQVLADATRAVAQLDADLSALRQQQHVLSDRSNSLRAIEQACRAWARSAGVVLPGADLPPAVTLPSAPPGAREFIQMERWSSFNDR